MCNFLQQLPLMRHMTAGHAPGDGIGWTKEETAGSEMICDVESTICLTAIPAIPIFVASLLGLPAAHSVDIRG
jgi:hypothetical protein